MSRAPSRHRQQIRKAGSEGKRKGQARQGLPSQSARGLGAARRVQPCVPCRRATPRATSGSRVPSLIHCALLRWRLSHGVY
jgi:hypothetical protein